MRDFEGYGDSATVQEKLGFVAEVLGDLFELLEEYGPRWYLEEHRNRAIAARHEVKQLLQLVNKEAARAQGAGR